LIKQEDIQKILEISDIVEVISDFVQLKKTGSSFKGLSPFTNEKTPSFVVSPSKRIFKDFSSGKGGNVISFLMEHEHLSYPEAIRFLARKYQVEIVEKEESPEEKEKQNERESLYQVNKFACSCFQDQLLNTDEGKAVALSYFKERGYDEKIIQKFELGYSLKEWDSLINKAKEKGYKKEYLVKTGLAVEKDDKSLYDRYRHRVIFPIHNLSGRILGFGGRILSEEKNMPKYVNSPESEIYQKSKILYGLYFAKNEIVKNDVCYLVEGYTDVISLYQSGIKNVVSSSGTSLTVEQIRLIKRYTNNITILYDGDDAGIKASFRGIDMILEEGLNVRIVLFPEGEDPDSFAKKHKDFEIQKYIEDNTKDFILFKSSLAVKEVKDDPIKKAAVLKEFVKTIALIPDGLVRRSYIKEVWETLGVAEETLNYEINKVIRQEFLKKNKRVQPEEFPKEKSNFGTSQEIDSVVNTEDIYEEELIKTLVLYGNDNINEEIKDEKGRVEAIEIKVSSFIISQLLEDELGFSNVDFQKIFDLISSSSDENGNYYINQQVLTGHENKNVQSLCIGFLSSPYVLSDNWFDKHGISVETPEENISLRTNIVNIIVLKFKSIKLRMKIKSITQEIKEINNDSDEALMFMSKLNKTKKILQTIDENLGHVIIRIKTS
jgi:DNA primase